MREYYWILSTFLTLFLLYQPNTCEGRLSINEDLNAKILPNFESIEPNYQPINIEQLFGGDEEEELEEEEEEEEDSGFYSNLISVTETENTNSTSQNKSEVHASIDAYLATAEGVDPEDPEEIARKKFYKANLDVFDQIVAINKNTNKSDRLQEGDVRHSGRNPFRNAGSDTLWTKKSSGPRAGQVLIPYILSSQYNSSHKSIIRSAMASYRKHTCIRFVPRRNEHFYLSIRDKGGCWAYVGKTGYSAQTVSLGIPGCVTKGIALHELMHAVGFQHEHSRNDRDNFVKVVRNNIQGGMEDNFDKHAFTRNLVVYDYGSVMHYSQHAFSKQPYLPSIEIFPQRKPEPRIGQRTRLSPYDIEEIKYLYDCADESYQRCGRNYVNQRRGSFQSPSYPNAYPKESHCTWNITVPSGRFIRIIFQNVDLFDSPLCESDAILVHDGINATAPILNKICGNHSSDIRVTSTGSNVFVIFSTDVSQNSNRGFRAVFRETSRQGSRPTSPHAPVLGPITSPVKHLYCNFDTDLCGMTQDSIDDLDYLQHRGGTPSRDTGPPGDHTTGKGQYIFVESSLPAKVGDNAIIRSPWFGRSNVFCVTFSYHMFGSYMGGLRLYAFEKKSNNNFGEEKLLWEIHGNQGRKWNTKRVTYRPRRNVQNLQFYWETFIYYYQSDIALDDISVVHGDCSTNPIIVTAPPPVVALTTNNGAPLFKATTVPPTPSVSTPPAKQLFASVNCTFDRDLCEFVQSTSDNFDWSRNSGHTPSASTGPSQDHTSGSGSYLFIEASSPRRRGHTARLESPPLTSSRHCLRFWYHMYGKQTGKLSILQVINGVSTLLVEKVGDNGNRWNLLSVDINAPNLKKSGIKRDYNENPRPKIEEIEEIEPEIIDEEDSLEMIKAARDSATANQQTLGLISAGELQIYIEASVGRGYAGDIAIDDIEITDSSCQQEIVVPTSSLLLENFSCDFENSKKYCNFIQSQDDDFDWVLNKGPTGSSGTGPDIDYTTGTDLGFYVYTESSSPRHINDIAELLTPYLKQSTYCIRFSYHMHGSATGEINIFSREKLPGSTFLNPIRLWRASGPQGDRWFTASAQFSPSSNGQAVQFIFQGMIGTSFTSDMALDDVSVTAGLCSPPSTTTTVQTTQKPTTTTQTTTTTTATTTQPTTTTTITTTQPTTTTTQSTTTTTKRTTTTQPKTTTTQPITTTQTRTTQPPTTTTQPKTTTTQPITTTQTRTTQPPTTTTQPKTTLPPTTTTQPASTTSSTTTTSSSSIATTTTSILYLSPYPQDFSCDFESINMCGMRQSTTDTFDWTSRKLKTPSKKTGPTHDHTITANKKGKYLYIEASSPRRINDVAVISTPSLAVQTLKRCLVFWYNMWGKGTGSLNVFANYTPLPRTRKSGGRSSTFNQLVFTESGNQGQSWRMGKVEINQSSWLHGGSVRISFHGMRGKSFLSDTAIDDICISEGPCDSTSRCSDNGVLRSTNPTPSTARPIGRVQSRRVTVTTAPQVTTTNAIRTPRNNGPTLWSGMKLCTFEKTKNQARNQIRSGVSIPGPSNQDLGAYIYPDTIRSNRFCGWKNAKGKRDQFDWLLNTGATVSRGTGPQGDKTTGNGYYLYIESSAPRKENEAAFLYSYPMPPSQYCVDLSYHMQGPFIGRLAVHSLQKLSNGRNITRLLRSVVGNQGSRWNRLQVNYNPRNDSQFVAFRIEGKVGKDYRGDIAIDDVSILPGQCDACSRPTHRFVNSLNQQQRFSTGCIDTSLFWVRCCGQAQEKAVYRKVTRCNPDMFTVQRLNWYCNNL